jgi:hypothetical protein
MGPLSPAPGGIIVGGEQISSLDMGISGRIPGRFFAVKTRMVDGGHFEKHRPMPAEPAYPTLQIGREFEPWIWRPPEHLVAHLPKQWGLGFACMRQADGNRIFYPLNRPASGDGERVHPGADFMADAFIGAMTRRINAGALTREQAWSYHVMWLLYQKVRHTQHYLKREFAGHRDVLLSAGGVDDDQVPHVDSFLKAYRRRKAKPTIISRGFGVGSQGDWADQRGGSPIDDNLTLDELLRAGGDAARSAGIEHPSLEAALQFGLIEIVRRATHLAIDREPRDLVHMALFGQAFAAADLESCLDHPLTAIILREIHARIDRDGPTFEKWFWGGKGSFVRQITKPKTPYDRDDVKHLLSLLGARALEYVGGCVHEQMYAIYCALRNAKAVTEPLNPHERAVFAHMYLKRPYLDDLPMVLLFDRRQFLMPVLQKIWERPDDPVEIGVLHRALQLYALLVAQRHWADNTRKKRKRPRTKRLPDEIPDRHEPQDEVPPTD